jgi:hypothetical protein
MIAMGNVLAGRLDIAEWVNIGPLRRKRGNWPCFHWWSKLRAAADGRRNVRMIRIDDLSDAEFMRLQAEYGDSLPICPICTLEDVRHLLLELVAGDVCRMK